MHFFVLCDKAPQVLHSYDAALTAPDLTQQVFLQCVHAPLRSTAGAADADAASLVEGVVVAVPPALPRADAEADAEADGQADASELRPGAVQHAEEQDALRALHPVLWSQAQVGAWLESVGLSALRKACRCPLDGVRLPVPLRVARGDALPRRDASDARSLQNRPHRLHRTGRRPSSAAFRLRVRARRQANRA
jgi:hypothetical protein